MLGSRAPIRGLATGGKERTRAAQDERAGVEKAVQSFRDGDIDSEYTPDLVSRCARGRCSASVGQLTVY